MAHDATVDVVRRYFAKIAAAGVPVERCVVFGSYARGEQTAENDIDPLIVAAVFDEKDRQVALDTVWRIAWRMDSRLEPIGVGVREYEKESWKPLLMVARQEGVVVYPEVQAVPRVAAECRATYRARRVRGRKEAR